MQKLVNITLFLALLVIALGAYTRLTEAGLGCPDWPGCYGFNSVPSTQQELASARLAFPEQAFDSSKAWNEMIHRYAAGLLGLLILALFFISARLNRQLPLTSLLLVLVLFQALLGMWTVTRNLQPIIVMGHLLGGFSILALLSLLRLRIAAPTMQASGELARLTNFPHQQRSQLVRIQGYCLLALPILIIQIALGGWTSSNYAAIVCTEFPICNGDWQHSFNLNDVFSMSPEAASYQYGVRDGIARMNIHISHRLWAIVTSIYLVGCVIKLLCQRPPQAIAHAGQILILLLALQVSLGIANVYFQLPIAIAVAHNITAAMLLLSLIKLLWLQQQVRRHLQQTQPQAPSQEAL